MNVGPGSGQTVEVLGLSRVSFFFRGRWGGPGRSSQIISPEGRSLEFNLGIMCLNARLFK